MANELQENILETISLITQSNIEKLEVDKTITAVIVKCLDINIGKYQVQYNGGTFDVYAEDTTKVYDIYQEVYVLVPCSDFSKKKIILGLASIPSTTTRTIDPYDQLSTNLFTASQTSYVIINNDTSKSECSLYETEKNWDEDSFKLLLDSADGILVSAKFLTKDLTQKEKASSGHFGIKIEMQYENDVVEILFDSNSDMQDNPKLYGVKDNKFVQQQKIFNISTTNYVKINSIIFYSKDFPSGCNGKIKMKDLIIKPIKISTNINNYFLSLSNNSIPTKVTAKEEYTSVFYNAKLMYKNNQNIINDATYYWYIADSNETSSNEYAGNGWRKIGQGQDIEITEFSDFDKTYYCCIAIYKTNTTDLILPSLFTIYNQSYSYKISLKATPNPAREGNIKISFDSNISSPTYIIKYKTPFSNEWNDFSTDEKVGQTILFKVEDKLLGDYIDVYCYVKINGIYKGCKIITIEKDKQKLNINYVLIENGSNSFKYNKYGISPLIADASPQTIDSLVCHLYDIENNEIDWLDNNEIEQYNIEWIVPSNSSLLEVESSVLTEQTLEYTIKDSYDNSAIDNQIQCKVIYNDNVYTDTTKFYFSKEGEHCGEGIYYFGRIEPDDYPYLDVRSFNIDKQVEFNIRNKLPIYGYLNGQYYNNGDREESLITTYSSTDLSLITWNILGDESSYFYIKRDGPEYLIYNLDTTKESNMILQTTYVLGEKEITTYFPIPIFNWSSWFLAYENIDVQIDKTKIITEVVYDALGQNPRYAAHNLLEGITVLGYQNNIAYDFDIIWDSSYVTDGQVIVPNIYDNKNNFIITAEIQNNGANIGEIIFPIYTYQEENNATHAVIADSASYATTAGTASYATTAGTVTSLSEIITIDETNHTLKILK